MKDWRKVRLDECTRIVGGATPSTSVPDYWDGEILWATPKDLSDLQSNEISDTARKITPAGLASCAAEILPVGAVLFSSRAPIGHVAIARAPIATNQGFKSFIPKPDMLDAGYLYWWLRCHRSYLEGLGNGATFKEVSKGVVSKIEIPLPPLDEQRRIAAILDQADALRRKRREAFSLHGSLRQALFTETFGDPVANTKGWRVVRFDAVCHRLTVGVVVKPASYYVDVGVPALRGTNIKPSGIDLSDVVYFSRSDNEGRLAKTRVWHGDLAIVRSGRPGQTAVVPESLDGANSIDILIATPDRTLVRSEFLSDFLNSENGRRLVTAESRGQVQQHFNVGSLSSAPIYLPPLKIQDEYLRKLEAMDLVVEMGTSGLLKLDRLFASLQHRAFNGDL